MLDGELSYIEGARQIAALRFSAGMEDDPDILPFVGIDSETDALPVGKVRELWKSSALESRQADIDRAEAWSMKFGQRHCQNLVERLVLR